MVGAEDGDPATLRFYEDIDFASMQVVQDGERALLAQTDKPLVVTELGIAAGSCLSLEDRADLIGERIDDYESMGAAGAMLWAFVPDPRPTECTFDIGPEDPIRALPQMARN